MKKALIAVGVVLALAMIGIVVAASMQPTDYEIERSARFDASPEQVYAVISDFHRYHEWSPWQKLDPEMKTTITGEPGEVGARYEWEGNDQAGQGSMTVARAVPNQEIELKLEFLKPFPAQSEVFWVLTPTEGGTEMVWRMKGHNENLMAKFFSMVFDMDKMVGSSFTEGLGNLKKLVEAEPATPTQKS